MKEAKAIRALAALLGYPDAELVAALPEIAGALAASQAMGQEQRARLVSLVDTLRASDGLDLEMRYVELFDRGRATSLNLFEHVHGESRDRGMAMVELRQLYAAAGYELSSRELPDYLPVMLEYLSCRDLDEARAMLGECAHILRSIGDALLRRGSEYAAVFDALLAIARAPGLDWSRAGMPPVREAPLDEDWAEVPAFAPAGERGGAGVPLRQPAAEGKGRS